MGLVQYLGAKTAPFSVSYNPSNGRPVNRMWAAVDNERSAMTKRSRWLPEPEANFYNALADFRILRWGTSTAQPVRTPVITSFSALDLGPDPEPQALPLHVLLQQQAQAMIAAAPPDAIITKTVEEANPEYLMSSSGTVHRPDCGAAKRIKEPKSFFTMEDVTADPDFKKFHTCCEGMA